MQDTDKSPTIGHLVRLVLERHPAFSANPLGDWRELVGDQVARYCQPRSLKRKVLTIVVHDSVWKHHLEMQKEALQERINRGRPEPLVEKIVILVGQVPAAMPVLNPQHDKLQKLKGKKIGPSKRKLKLRTLTAEEEALLKELPDPELRRLGARLLRRVTS